MITAPFACSAEEPLQPELVKLEGKTIRYLAAIPKGVTTQSLMTGFGGKASDYDFTVTNTATGFGQRIRADQPIAKINMWSITPPTAWSPISPFRSSPARPNAGPTPTISLDRRRPDNEMTSLPDAAGFDDYAAFAGQGNAPFVPVTPDDTSPASALDDMPSKTISNGLVSAKVYLPDPFGFYRATRFDHAGMITHITYKGQDYGRYWFVKTSPDVKNFTYDKDGLVAQQQQCRRRPGGGIRRERF